MQTVVQALILGVLTGGVYALMASGLTLVFGIMRVINVAQGAFVILAAYLSHSLFTRFGLDPFLSILLLIPAMFVAGVAVQLVFVRSLRGAHAPEMSLLVTWALALGIEGLLSVVYRTTVRSTNTSYADRSWTVGHYQFSEPRVFGFAASVAILTGLYGLLRFSRFGRSIRAVVQNPSAARLLGVNDKLVSAFGFGIGAATAAAAGALYGVVFPFNPGSHYDLISRLLSIVVLGGLGSVGGAIAAALVMGVVQSVVAVEYSPTWAALSFFVILLAVLLVRPQGFFGLRERVL
ncbi:MAG TPA: branched-chain amino acid ABC transporter permease [Gaiellaceae bacterium]|jgi:branched-chain amino acid transport system permease protein|nr:branched-chain amino acid ABC transporter permease [Gaiellaceae bacterium]